MLNKNRMIALLLALLLAATAAGCAGKTAQEPAPAAPEAQSEPVDEHSPDPDAQAAAFEAAAEEDIVLQATGVASDEIVATVDGNSAPAELLAYQIGYSCSYLDYMFRMYGMDPLDLSGTMPDGQDAAEFVRAESLNMVKQQLVLENLTAKYGLTVSAEAEAEMAQQKLDNIAEYGEAGYRAEVRKLGLSEEGYERVMRANYLYEALYDAYADPNSALYVPDETIAAYAAEQGYITADHILISTRDADTNEPLSDEEIETRRALAEDLLWRLRDSRDPIALFKELADEYSEDPGRATNPDGYTFPEETMVDVFDYEARRLPENEYSDIVETDYGFHIILRKPLDVAAAAEAVRGEYLDRVFLDEADAAELTLTPAAERIDVAAVYDALMAAQTDDADVDEPQNPFAP